MRALLRFGQKQRRIFSSLIILGLLSTSIDSPDSLGLASSGQMPGNGLVMPNINFSTPQNMQMITTVATLITSCTGPQMGNAPIQVQVPSGANPGAGGFSPQISAQTPCPPIAVPDTSKAQDCVNFDNPDGSFAPQKLTAFMQQVSVAQNAASCRASKLQATQGEVSCLQKSWAEIQNTLSQLNDVFKSNVSTAKTALTAADTAIQDGATKITNLMNTLGSNKDDSTTTPGLLQVQKTLQQRINTMSAKIGTYTKAQTSITLATQSLQLAVAKEKTADAISCMKTQTNPSWRCSPSDPPTTAEAYAICRYRQIEIAQGGQMAGASQTTISLAGQQANGLQSVIDGMYSQVGSASGASPAVASNVTGIAPNPGDGSTIGTGSDGSGAGAGGGADNSGGNNTPGANVKKRVAKVATKTSSSKEAMGTSADSTTTATGITTPAPATGVGTAGLQFTNAATVAATYDSQLQAFNSPGLPITDFMMQALANCFDQANTQVINEQADPGSALGARAAKITQDTQDLNNGLQDYFTQFQSDYQKGQDALFPNQNSTLDMSQCTTPTGTTSTAALGTEISCLTSAKTALNTLLTGGTNANTTIQINGSDSGTPPLALVCSGINGCIKVLQSWKTTLTTNQQQLSQTKKTFISQFNQSADTFMNWAASQLRPASQQLTSSIDLINNSLHDLGVTGSIGNQAITDTCPALAPADGSKETDPIPPGAGNSYPGLAQMPNNPANCIASRVVPSMKDLSGLGNETGVIAEAQKTIADDLSKLAAVGDPNALAQQCQAQSQLALIKQLQSETANIATSGGCYDTSICPGNPDPNLNVLGIQPVAVPNQVQMALNSLASGPNNSQVTNSLLNGITASLCSQKQMGQLGQTVINPSQCIPPPTSTTDPKYDECQNVKAYLAGVQAQQPSCNAIQTSLSNVIKNTLGTSGRATASQPAP